MQGEPQHREDLLLDWHLCRLSPEDQSWMDAELDRDLELRAQSDRLGHVLQPLDHWHAPPCPANLAEKALDFVRSATREPVLSIAPPAESAGRRGPTFRWRDVTAAAACIVVLIGALVPAMSMIRGRAREAQCAGNLASIFEGTGAYQAMFNDSLPYAGRPTLAAWLPTASDRPFRSNSRHVFQLVKYNCGPKPADFICPSDRRARPMLVKDVGSLDDFTCGTNVSYDSLNLVGPKPNVRPGVPLVYISDANPLFLGGRFNRGVDADTTNSPAHGGRGQNVMTTTGQAIFLRTPLFGARSDNVWLAGNIREYRGIESPVGEDDVQLVPGCPGTPSPAGTSQR
jgi:hypothetical protein